MKNILMVGNTHFDPVWTWTWEEAMTDIHSTFRSALDRLKEDDEFIYSFATPPVFEWIKKIDPLMFEEIKQRVKEGRWELFEGWWVQPDNYTACGESYARQSLYGQQYLMDNFGKYSSSVFNIDSFGHNSQIPQILRKSHMKYYCMCRPDQKFFDIKSPFFLWRGKDGSEVKTFRIGQNSIIYNQDIEANVKMAEEKMINAIDDEMMVFGVSNHGGAPTKKAMADIRRLDAEKDYSIKFSSVEGYFEAQNEPTVIVDTEMITKNFGPYVNDRQTKIINRKAEYSVLNAEASSVIAQKVLNIPYDGEKLSNCWKDILFNTFHDILGGASIKEACYDARNSYGKAIATSDEIKFLNLFAITKKIKTPGKNGENIWNFIVWNLNDKEYDGYMEGELQWLQEFPAYSGGILLEDDRGNKYPCQVILEKSVIKGFRSRVLFKAKIPAMGYKMFKVIKTGDIDKTKTHSCLIETEQFKVQLDEKTGLIKTIYSKLLDKTFTDILKPQCFEDNADCECFNVNNYDKKLEEFVLTDLKTTESGEFRTTLKASYKFRNSILHIYYVFYKNENYFDVKYVVNWNEQHVVLKLLTKIDCEKTIVASPFASEERADNITDMPMGEWICFQNKNYGIGFIGDSSFAYNKEGNEVGISVLRSCIYTDLRMDEDPLPDEDYNYMEQGITEGEIRVLPYKGSYAESGIFDMAKSFNNPPIIICEPNHDGILPAEKSFISVDSSSVLMSTVKKMEKGDNIILRLSEVAGVTQSVNVTYFDNNFKIGMKPYEIKTIMITGNSFTEVNITED